MNTAAIIYIVICILALGFAAFYVERKTEKGRRIEQLQQLICTIHFLAVIGWIERSRLGFVPEGQNALTGAGVALEIAAVATALLLAFASVVINPGVNWRKFFTVFGTAAVIHAVVFGGAALLWSSELGYAPSPETVLEEGINFGQPLDSSTPEKTPQ